MDKSNNLSSRRKFIQQTAMAGAGLAVLGPMKIFASGSSQKALTTKAVGVVAEVENSCEFSTTVYAWLRNDIPFEIGHTYWRDIHGTLISRIPGTYLYRQLHLSPMVNVLSAKFQPYVKQVKENDQPQGIAHTFYLDEAGRDRFFNHPLTKAYMVEDEVNLVRINATLWSRNDDARTLKDTSDNLEPQGKPVNDEYIVSFIFIDKISRKSRKEQLLKIAKALVLKSETTRVRYHLLEDYDDENFPDTLVTHHRPVGVRYNAWIELGVKKGIDLSVLLETELSKILPSLDTIHIQPISDKYTIMAKEKATIVGMKGFPAYETILAAGAKNQLREDLLHDIYGDVPRKD